jgi:hypothetical protein
MSVTIAVIFIFSILQTEARVQHFIPTSEVVRIGGMAARDEGYYPDVQGTYLSELRNAEGKEPIPGYASIGLYVHGHLVRDYAIRIETGDVVDPSVCKVFRYPNLLTYKKKLMKEFGTKDASLNVIASEVGCNKLEIVTAEPLAKALKKAQP